MGRQRDVHAGGLPQGLSAARPDGTALAAAARAVRSSSPVRRGRRIRLGTAVAAGLLAVPAGALGVATVNLDQTRLTVTVNAAADDLNQHGVMIEPFRDSFRDGWRVRQIAGGDARIADGDVGACVENGLANDVVCSGARSSILFTGGPGADRVTVADSQAIGDVDPNGFFGAPAGDIRCLGTPDASGSLTVDLGGGADVYRYGLVQGCPAGFFPSPGFVAAPITVSGGDGADQLLGGPVAETLRGGARGDTVRGGGGDDTLAGDQPLGAGQTGGPDLLDGGPGNDTVTYQGVALPVGVIIGDGVAQDGALGPVSEGDEVTAGVENVIGGGSSDAIVGTEAPNRLTGGGGRDNLDGRGGTDTLDGGIGDDSLSGGTESDTLLGGEGNDVIGARDGVRDTIDCGPGTDTAFVDLQDPGNLLIIRGRIVGCESVLASAIDDGPPARIAGPRLRRAGGRAVVALACPRDARVRCRGVLSLRAASAPARLLARARYDVARGRRAKVALTLRRPARGRIVATTVERGVSRLGPRRAFAVLRA